MADPSWLGKSVWLVPSAFDINRYSWKNSFVSFFSSQNKFKIISFKLDQIPEQLFGGFVRGVCSAWPKVLPFSNNSNDFNNRHFFLIALVGRIYIRNLKLSFLTNYIKIYHQIRGQNWTLYLWRGTIFIIVERNESLKNGEEKHDEFFISASEKILNF